MAPAWMEHTVTWLSFYVFRGVPLLSLSMHLILTIFSGSRRREDRGWKRLLVWVAYQLTDWGPAYVISNLYLEPNPPEKMIVAFWVPFLLLHHSRPDNISAYTVEDSVLWIRLIVSVLPKSGGSIFIVYRLILTDCAADWPLRWASSIMLFLGIWKYLESAVALWLSNLGHIRNWLPKKQINLSDVKRLSEKQTDFSGLKDEASVKEKDDEALLVAHGLFEICKGAFCDYTVDMDRDAFRGMFSGKWERVCTVVEMELSLMYDILYTKAAVVHTLPGYAIRLASAPLTAFALLLFGLHCKEGMKPIDKAISYIFLSTTFVLDVIWLFRALASAWTYSFFKFTPHNWLKHEFWCQRRWKKLRGCVMFQPLSWLSSWLWTCECCKEPKSYRRWAGTFGKRNLLHKCIAGNKCSLCSILRRLVVSEDQSRLRGLELEDHSSSVEIPRYVKKLVFSNICGKLFPLPRRGKNPEPSNTISPGPLSPGKPSTGSKSPERSGGTATSSPSRPGCGKLPDYCTCLHPGSPDPDKRCLDIPYEPPGPAYPRERICNGIHDEPPPWLHYPRGWIRTDVGIRATPCPQYPWQPICIGINSEPPRLPCPCQVRAGMRNGPFEANRYNALARPFGHPEEQSAEDHWRCYYYEQAPPEAYEQAAHSWVHGLNRFAYRQDTPNTYVQDDDQAKADIEGQHGDQTKPMESDEDMGFPPELQEVILICHIATDVFFSCSPKITGEESIEHEKAIEQMSDYMVFLVAKRPEMLPGLKLRSLYKSTQGALKKIRDIKAASEGCNQYTRNVTKEKEELAKWMPENMDHLKDKNTDIIWEGTRLARVLLRLVPQDVQPKWSVAAEEVAGTVKKLECWVPGLKDRTSGSMKGMLEFILDAWVRLLMYASMRCSRDSHAKQLSRGGELTTLVWIITEHAKTSFVKEQLPLLFPPKKEKIQ